MNCYEAKENFGALIDGELTEAEKEALLSHIAECEECRKEYEELRALKKEFSKLTVQLDGALAQSAMARVYSQAIPEKKKTPFFFRYIGTAAALVIIASLFIYTRLTPANESAENDTANALQTESVTVEDSKDFWADKEEAGAESVFEAETEKNAAATDYSEKHQYDGVLNDVTPEEAPMPESALGEATNYCKPSYVIDVMKIGVIFVDVEVEDLVPLFDNVEKVDKDCLTVNSTPQDVMKVLTQNGIEVLNTDIPTDVESTTIMEQD